MPFSITPGIAESDLTDWLTDAARKYGTFDDGRVNYKNANTAPIVMCTVKYGDEILLVKRGYGLADAEGYWSTVNGFIDEVKPVARQAQQEIHEELGLNIEPAQITVRPSYTLKNPAEKRAYIVFPCLITLLSKLTIKLDAENTEFTWIKRTDLVNYETLEDLPYTIDRALGL